MDANQIEHLLCEYIRNSQDARSVLSELKGIQIDGVDIQKALVEVLGVENHDHPIELLERDLSAGKIICLLRNFDFVKFHPEVLLEISFDESVIPEGIPRLLTEATIKCKGEVWQIYKNDSDPFPSNPHAHCGGLKLHLGNGDLYWKRTKKGLVSKKNLLQIRSRAEAKKIVLPALAI